MSPKGSNEAPASRLLVMGTVLFYLVAALAMVIANKWVLNDTKAPLFFLLTQIIIAVALFLISHILRFIELPFTLDWQLCKGLIPMVSLSVIGLSFSNYTLKYVDASFYQVARGMVLPFTVATSFVALHARPSLRILLSCTIVTLGFFIGVFLDGSSVSMTGVSFGVASSLITAVHSVVIKKSLELVKGNALHLSWYSNLLSAFLLAPIVVLAGEGPAVTELFMGDGAIVLPGAKTSELTTFIWGSAITGVLGFLMSIASLLSIKVTSPITHMVSSAVRGVAASLLGVYFFGDLITTGRAASIGVILLGSIYYTWVKHVESQQAQASSSASKSTYERVPLEDVESGKAKNEGRLD